MEDGHLGFAIGDVSGKGISAALIMASLRASLRGLVLDDPIDLARMMQKVNRLVYEASSSSRYATFFFATLDPHTREFRYVNAGHNPPRTDKAGFRRVCRLEACGPVVGMLPFAEYEAQSMILRAWRFADRLYRWDQRGHDCRRRGVGRERLLAAIPRRSNTSAEEILDAIFRAADEFTAGAEQHDDMTLLVMKLL